MSAGTLTLTTNSDVVTGTGTNFSTELAAGDFAVVVVGGITYTLPVKSVDSATKLTLVSKYPGPSQNGLAWNAVPRLTQNLITAAVVAQATEALRGLNYDKQNWQQVFSGTGTVTVKLPDGTTYTGPAWGGIASSLTGKMDKSHNLNDVADKADARTNLGLGSAATAALTTSSTDMTLGRVLKVGDFGLGRTNLNASDATLNANDVTFACFSSGPGGSGSNYYDPYATMITGVRAGGGDGTGYVSQIQLTVDNRMASRRRYLNAWSPWAIYYSSSNTTTASDGTLKAASPVARIVKSQEENQRKDVDEEGFIWCGCGTANAEAEGINISRLDVGIYLLTGSAGLASEGWQLLPPMDPAGMGELGIVEAEQTESGGLTIRLFRRKYMLTESGEMMKTKGEPIDVPANSWIDIRLDMPEDSIWNKSIAGARHE